MTRRSKGLTDEDRAIWDSVAKQVKPLHTKPDPVQDRPLPAPKPAKTTQSILPFQISGSQREADLSMNVAAPLRDALNGAPVQMDRKAYGKLSRGKLSPEARIDLHGMTVDRAHPALQRFILDASTDGLRLVLVITGKGKHKDDGGPIPVRKGILRHAVPQWLRLAPLAPLILEIRPAHLRHGGDGAYYVYLRRRR